MRVGRHFTKPNAVRDWTILSLAFVFLIVVIQAISQPPAPGPDLQFYVNEPVPFGSEAFKSKVKSLFNTKDTGFSGAVLVSHGTHVVFKSGFGSASIEPPRQNGVEAQYRIGSLTKQFVAAGILKLTRLRKLALSDALCKVLKNSCSEPAGAITIHELLAHISGLPSISCSKVREIQFKAGQWIPLSDPDPISLIRGCNLINRGKYSYSNLNYLLLGRVIEEISRQPLERYLAKEIFQPLKMLNTGLTKQSSISRSIAQKALSKYPFDNGWYEDPRPSEYRYEVLSGAGAAFSTPTDLLRWSIALDSPEFLTNSERKLMFTPVKSNYGYAWVIQPWKSDGPIIYWHNGEVLGFYAAIYKIPDRDITIIVAMNRARYKIYDRIIDSLVDACLGRPFEVPRSP